MKEFSSEIRLYEIKAALDKAKIRMNNYRFEGILIKFIKDNIALFKKHQLKSVIKNFVTSKKSYHNSTQIMDAYASILHTNEIFEKFLQTTDGRRIYRRLAKNKYVSEANLYPLFENKEEEYNNPKL